MPLSKGRTPITQFWASCNSLVDNRHFAVLVQQKYHNYHLIYVDGAVQNGSTGCGIYSSIDNSAGYQIILQFLPQKQKPWLLLLTKAYAETNPT